jgi:hypothetical protein
MSTFEQVVAAPGRIETSDLLSKFSVCIELPDGDVAVLDEEFCKHVLFGAHRRTAKRYEDEGLPRLEIRHRVFRPLRRGQRWLATRIKARKPPASKRKALP